MQDKHPLIDDADLVPTAELPVLTEDPVEPNAASPEIDSSDDPDDTARHRTVQLEPPEHLLAAAERPDRWDEMERLLNSQTERIVEMERQLEQRATREHALEQRVHEAHLQVEELRAKLAETHEERQRVDDELKRLENMLAERERAIDQQNERVTALQQNISERVAALAEAQITPIPTSSTEQRPAVARAANGAVPVPVLICLTGPKPERHVINAPETLIGRGPDCAIRILTHFASREHARLMHENGKVIIQDCGSKNGVFVNSIRVDRHELKHGDWITIGKTQFRFLLEGAQA